MNNIKIRFSVASLLLILIISIVLMSCGSSSPELAGQEEVEEEVPSIEEESEAGGSEAAETENVEESSMDPQMGEQKIETLPGFETQMLYEVPLESQGSWVSLGLDRDGYLIAADQRDKGTYRITVNGDIDNPEVDVERLLMPISGAQGIEWAFDHLYMNVQRPDASGLYRLSENRGDGSLNVLEYLDGSGYLGEHGNHAVVRGY